MIIRVSERLKLSGLVTNVLDDNANSSEGFTSLYETSRLKDLKVLLKCEFLGPQKSPQRYAELDIDKSLAWNLQEKTIVEHPVIAVVHETHADFYIDRDNIEVSYDENDIKSDHNVTFTALNFTTEEEETVQAKPNNLGLTISMEKSDNNAPTPQRGTAHQKQKKGIVSSLVACYSSSEEDNIV